MLTDIRGEDGLLAPFILEKNLEDKFYEIRVTKELLVNPILTIQLQIVDGEKVWNSKQACLLVHNSLNIGEGKMPSGIDNWLEQAGNKLNEADQKIQEIEKTIKEFKEKDPTIPEYIKNITEEQISNWDEGGNVDLSDYYTKEEIDNKGYITEIPEVEFEQVQSDWGQNDETAPSYIKNKPFYETTELGDVYIINSEKTFEFDGGDVGGYWGTLTLDEQDAIKKASEKSVSELKIVFDGIEGTMLYNPSYGNWSCEINGTGIELSEYNDFVIMPAETGDETITHTISISYQDEVTKIEPIPEKFLPDTIATKEYVDEKFNSIVNGDEVSY